MLSLTHDFPPVHTCRITTDRITLRCWIKLKIRLLRLRVFSLLMLTGAFHPSPVILIYVSGHVGDGENSRTIDSSNGFNRRPLSAVTPWLTECAGSLSTQIDVFPRFTLPVSVMSGNLLKLPWFINGGYDFNYPEASVLHVVLWHEESLCSPATVDNPLAMILKFSSDADATRMEGTKTRCWLSATLIPSFCFVFYI